MSSLLTVPVEVFDMILSYLGKTDLAATAQVCKSTSRLTESILYGSILWENPLLEALKGYTDGIRRDKLDLLLRSVLNRPALGHSIHHLTFFGPKNISAWENQPSSFTNNELQLARARIRQLNQTRPETEPTLIPSPFWEEQLESGLVNAMLALLLFLTPNLQSLILDFDHIEPESPPFPFVGMALSSSAHFQALTRAEFSVRMASRIFHATSLDQTAISSLFYLPVITSISLSRLDTDTFRWHKQSTPKCESLRSLSCLCSLLNENNLETWLIAAPNISSVKFEIEIDMGRLDDRWTHSDKLKKALNHTRDTLRDLTIYTSYSGSNGDPALIWDYELKPAIGSLKNFARLESLTMPMTLLLGSHPDVAAKLEDLLPRNLIRFCILDNGFAFENWTWTPELRSKTFADFVDVHKDYVPQLKVFGVALANIANEIALERPFYDFTLVKDACKRSCIDFELHLLWLNGEIY